VKSNPRGANEPTASRGANELLELPPEKSNFITMEESNFITLHFITMRLYLFVKIRARRETDLLKRRE
jgi:hypothetical protein